MTLAGVWYNELHSTMTIEIKGNLITGTYQTAVGDASGLYQLTGSFDANPTSSSQSVGWVVTWNNDIENSNCVTSWCGKLQVINGKETITAMWLLSEESEVDDNWRSTVIGKDVFTRTKPAV
jgi:Avidin family